MMDTPQTRHIGRLEIQSAEKIETNVDLKARLKSSILTWLLYELVYILLRTVT
jgi:hypothetical protein